MYTKGILLIIILKCICFNYSYSQQKDSAGIYVMNVDFRLLTLVAVHCEGFAARFPSMMKHGYICNKDSLVILDSFLAKVKYNKRNKEIDVRGQIYYIKPGHARVSICINDNAVMVDGRLIQRNDKFITFLRSMML